MSSIPEKWKASRAKTDFVLKFPGLRRSWEECRGKTIKSVVSLGKRSESVLILDDGSFLVAPSPEPDARGLHDGLGAARRNLEKHYGEAFKELDRLEKADRDLRRKARLENILGAVRNNAPEIPQLKKALRNLLDSLPD